jgi:hypothetical protein
MLGAICVAIEKLEGANDADESRRACEMGGSDELF